jgi:pimeloyl-ACP methyl ester carboxylesterase
VVAALSDEWRSTVVSIGAHRLHAAWAGEGQPTVVLDHALAASSQRWGPVPRAVATFTRVFAYDRAGCGRSELAQPAAGARTTRDCVNDLHALLASVPLPPPYVLVGHSFGGLNALLYASQYPDEVVGMVQIDATTPEDADARYRSLLSPRLKREWTRMARRRNAEGIDLATSRAQVRGDLRLRPMPLVVLSSLRDETPPGWPAEQLERARLEFQAALAGLVPGGRHVLAEDGGHFIQEDRPDLVIDAVRAVVSEAREPPVRLPRALVGGARLVASEYGGERDQTSACAIERDALTDRRGGH